MTTGTLALHASAAQARNRSRVLVVEADAQNLSAQGGNFAEPLVKRFWHAGKPSSIFVYFELSSARLRIHFGSPSFTHASLKRACFMLLPSVDEVAVDGVDVAVLRLDHRRVVVRARSSCFSRCRVHFQVLPSSSESDTARLCPARDSCRCR